MIQRDTIGCVSDRMTAIAPLVSSGAVLDLGVVDSRRAKRSTDSRLEKKTATSLFSKICEINSHTLGVDIDKQGIEILQSQGYHVRHADVMTMNLNQSFDAIIAGELIEHLPNPGLFLENMVRHLNPGGTLLLTTPNPFYSKQTWKIWRYGEPSVHEEHTCWFDPITLSALCRLSGLEPTAIYWVQKRNSWLKSLPSRARNFFSHSFILTASPN